MMYVANTTGPTWTGRSCDGPAAAEADRCMVQIDAVVAEALRAWNEGLVMQWMECGL
jgi:hypothetical protein